MLLPSHFNPTANITIFFLAPSTQFHLTYTDLSYQVIHTQPLRLLKMSPSN
ncbi:hypothetical protein LguiA_016347 [Lonicera macranthoides]